MNQPQESTVVPTLQDVVSSLQRFWIEQGCVWLAPCDFEVPFATLHPEAFFNLLGSTPWQAAYLQPVRRPLDGRYGQHPYRLNRHQQFEVILKPPLVDIQSLYLASLEAVGLELRLHDVHFAEWKWQARSLGVKGSGWHALVDGLGITRMTFLEQVADRDLDPVGVEISYGLERLMMLHQGVASAFDIVGSRADGNRGAQHQRDEEEVSRYVFEIADVADLRSRLQALERDAERCLVAGLARPAYELAVRCLELIDTLEARGEVSPRERSGFLDRVRERVVAAAELDLARETETPEAADRGARRLWAPLTADGSHDHAAADAAPAVADAAPTVGDTASSSSPEITSSSPVGASEAVSSQPVGESVSDVEEPTAPIKKTRRKRGVRKVGKPTAKTRKKKK